MILPYVASGALGIIAGWLIWTFVQRATTLTVQAVGALASLAAGGAVIGAAAWGDAVPTDAVLVYPIGALIAIVLLGVMENDPQGRFKRRD